MPCPHQLDRPLPSPVEVHVGHTLTLDLEDPPTLHKTLFALQLQSGCSERGQLAHTKRISVWGLHLQCT